MGFFGNIGADCSPLYKKFLYAKQTLGYNDTSIIVNIIAFILIESGFITKEEYLLIKKNGGVNWGTRWNMVPNKSIFCNPEFAELKKEGYVIPDINNDRRDLCIYLPQDLCWNSLVMDFLEKMGLTEHTVSRVVWGGSYIIFKGTSYAMIDEGHSADTSWWIHEEMLKTAGWDDRY